MARRHDIEVGGGEEGRRIVLPAKEAHTVGDAELDGLALQLAAQRTVAGQPEPGPGHRRQRLQQDVEGLVLVQAAEREDQRSLCGRAVGGAVRGRRCGVVLDEAGDEEDRSEEDTAELHAKMRSSYAT